MKRSMIGVIGGVQPSKESYQTAYEVGSGVAAHGWTLVTGGLGGVMEAASRGAYDAGGAVVGILPGGMTADANPYVTIPVATNMGHARNAIIAHTADVLVAIGGAYGTLSEIAFANVLGKKVLGLESWRIEGIQNRSSIDDVFRAIDAVLRGT